MVEDQICGYSSICKRKFCMFKQTNKNEHENDESHHYFDKDNVEIEVIVDDVE